MNHFPSTYLSLGPGTHRRGAHSPEALDPVGKDKPHPLQSLRRWKWPRECPELGPRACGQSRFAGSRQEAVRLKRDRWAYDLKAHGAWVLWDLECQTRGLDLVGFRERSVVKTKESISGMVPDGGWMMPGSYWNIQANDSQCMVSPSASPGSLLEMHILGSPPDLWTQSLWASGQSVLGSPDLMLMPAEVQLNDDW